jgi:pyruvate dehydrogenase E1 component beta subunit
MGVARVARKGSDVTIAAIGSMVNASLRAANSLADVDAEVIDLRSIRPLDTKLVVESVRRTGRLVTVHESWVTAGLGAEIVAAVAETCPESLRGPVVRLGTAPVPTPSGKVRPCALPSTERIVEGVKKALGR